MDESAASATDLEIWERLLNEQSVLFRKTAARNVTLEERVEELERELSVWKAALKKSDEEKRALSKSILKLERSIGSLRDDSPLVLCLIDGDGNIFSPELLAMGQAGGRQAASLITKGLNDYLSSIDSPEVALSGRGQIWLTIYCNKTGLLEVLTQNNVCTAEQFEAFVLGFNQSSPLFSIVDVGNGKEAADTKLKECLRVFTRFPQTWKVFFGGTHDNGYTSTLAALQNEGLIDKMILLRGYTKLAYEIKGLELPDMEIEGLFLKKKLYSYNNKKPSNPNTPYYKQHIEHEVSRSNAPTPSSRSQASASPPGKTKVLDPTLPLYKQNPLPCNFYYLAECKKGQKCHFGHDYVLTPAQLTILRETARKWPCPYANRGFSCHLGDNCVMAHVCPKGATCSFAKQKRCKFIAKDAHGKAEEVSRNLLQQTPESKTPNYESPQMELSAHLRPQVSPVMSSNMSNSFLLGDFRGMPQYASQTTDHNYMNTNRYDKYFGTPNLPRPY